MTPGGAGPPWLDCIVDETDDDGVETWPADELFGAHGGLLAAKQRH